MTAADDLRASLAHETQHLLGATIAVTDEQWHAPSSLPGWTRAHLATHIARNADGLVRLIRGALDGTPAQMYPSDEVRDAEIAEGATRSGLELQQDLDASAGRFGQAFDELAESGRLDAVVTMRGGAEVPAGLLGVARLGEVVLHHADLALGYSLTEADGPALQALLEWASRRMGRKPEMPPVLLRWEGGELSVGKGEPTAVVEGTPAALLGWLTGRDGGAVTGADGIAPPPY